jgi:hypothetical protein
MPVAGGDWISHFFNFSAREKTYSHKTVPPNMAGTSFAINRDSQVFGHENHTVRILKS